MGKKELYLPTDACPIDLNRITKSHLWDPEQSALIDITRLNGYFVEFGYNGIIRVDYQSMIGDNLWMTQAGISILNGILRIHTDIRQPATNVLSSLTFTQKRGWHVAAQRSLSLYTLPTAISIPSDPPCIEDIKSFHSQFIQELYGYLEKTQLVEA